MSEKKVFLNFFDDSSPALDVKYSNTSDEKSKRVLINHKLCSAIDKKGRKYLEINFKDQRLNDFVDFYINNDGFDFCTPVYPDNFIKTPALKFIPAGQVQDFNKQYIKGGKWAWTIDLNKSKSLYRGDDEWVAFAEIKAGPSALCIFLTGENTGCIYFITPQPHFNILKPIAKNFSMLLERIAKDPAVFLRLIRSYITMRGSDGQNYGLVATDYISDSNK